MSSVDAHEQDMVKQLSHFKRNLGKDPNGSKKTHKNTDHIEKNKKHKNKKDKEKKRKHKKGERTPPTMSIVQSSMKQALNNKYHEIVNNPKKFSKESQWIAPANALGVKYIGYLGSTGYADAAKGYIRSLVESGTYVYVEPVRYCDEKSSETLTEDDLVLAICLHNKQIKYDQVIIHSIPNEWKDFVKTERKRNPSVQIYGLTVWETDRVDPDWMSVINDLSLTGLIVPSQWNCQTFINTAKNLQLKKFPPVHVCHHAITNRIRQSQSKSISRTELYGLGINLALLCIGTWTCRKGVEESIRAYLTAFTGKKDVVLYLKTSDGAYNTDNNERLKKRLKTICDQYSNAPKIILDTNLRSDDYIDDLTNNCDVYLSLCNSEGVGLGACQSALKGKIIVMTGYGGQIEYIKEACWVDYEMDLVRVPNKFVEWIHPPQQWGYPSIEHACKYLQEIYDNKPKYMEKASLNRPRIMSQFSYLARGQVLKEIFNTKKKKH